MADQKLSALSAALVASANDLFYLVTSASVSQKIPFSTLKTSLFLPTYAGTGNKYIMADTAADTVSAFRLIQSGASITISTANNNIIISAATGNLSTKQDVITYPLGINSGGSGIAVAGSATSLVGINSSGSVYDYYNFVASNNMIVNRVGTTFFLEATTGTGASTSGIVYAPTGGFYAAWSSDTLLSNEKVITASNNIVITTGASTLFISATTGIPITYAATGNAYAVLDFASDLTNEFRLVQSGNSITISTAGNLIIINANTGGGGAGDITGVGDVASGEAFVLGSSQGTIFWFHQDGSGVAQGAPYFMFLNSGGSIPSGTPSRYNINGDFFIGNASGGAHLFLAPDQGIIRGYGQTGENAGTSFESFGGPESFVELRGANGTYAIPTTSMNADLVGANYFSGFDSSNFLQLSAIHGLVDGVVSLGTAPGRIEFHTSSGGSLIKRLIIDSRGTVSFVSSGGFNTTVNPHRATAARTIFTPDSSGTFAINSRYPILLSSGGNLSVSTGATGQVLITSGGVLGDLVWVNTLGGAAGAVYAATGNDYVVMNLAADLTSDYRLVQSGNNITISTAGNMIVINATTGAGGSTKTVRIPMALMSVEVNSGNAFWTAQTDGVRMDKAYINMIDSGRSVSTWWCMVPTNVNATPAWSVDIFSEAAALGATGGFLVLNVDGMSVATGESANALAASTINLVSAGSFLLNTAGILTMSTMSATNFDGSLATSATDLMKIKITRQGNADTFNSDWYIYSVNLKCTVDM